MTAYGLASVDEEKSKVPQQIFQWWMKAFFLCDDKFIVFHFIVGCGGLIVARRHRPWTRCIDSSSRCKSKEFVDAKNCWNWRLLSDTKMLHFFFASNLRIIIMLKKEHSVRTAAIDRMIIKIISLLFFNLLLHRWNSHRSFAFFYYYIDSEKCITIEYYN